MNPEEIHGSVNAAGFTHWHLVALLHALVDLGHIRAWECELPDCRLETRDFRPRRVGRGYDAYTPTLDHIDPRGNGGSHRPQNLRLLHHACNLAVTAGRVDSPELREKKKAGRARFLAEGDNTAWLESMKHRPEGWNRATRNDDQRRAGSGRTSKPKALTGRQVQAVRRAYARGIKLEPLAEKYGVSRSTMHSAINGKHAYADT